MRFRRLCTTLALTAVLLSSGCCFRKCGYRRCWGWRQHDCCPPACCDPCPPCSSCCGYPAVETVGPPLAAPPPAPLHAPTPLGK